ncbi:MAG: hypothetical protein V8T12_01820 [Parabacteroides johnsonii]
MDTNNVDALNAVARNAINFGRIAEAKQCYHKVLEADSMNFYANYQLARLYYQLGDYGKATEHYHILASIEGENPSILTGLADCHIKRGTGPNTMIALSLYARALEAEPGKCACSFFSDKHVITDGRRKGCFAGVRYRLVL